MENYFSKIDSDVFFGLMKMGWSVLSYTKRQ